MAHNNLLQLPDFQQDSLERDGGESRMRLRNTVGTWLQKLATENANGLLPAAPRLLLTLWHGPQRPSPQQVETAICELIDDGTLQRVLLGTVLHVRLARPARHLTALGQSLASQAVEVELPLDETLGPEASQVGPEGCSPGEDAPRAAEAAYDDWGQQDAREEFESAFSAIATAAESELYDDTFIAAPFDEQWPLPPQPPRDLQDRPPTPEASQEQPRAPHFQQRQAPPTLHGIAPRRFEPCTQVSYRQLSTVAGLPASEQRDWPRHTQLSHHHQAAVQVKPRRRPLDRTPQGHPERVALEEHAAMPALHRVKPRDPMRRTLVSLDALPVEFEPVAEPTVLEHTAPSNGAMPEAAIPLVEPSQDEIARDDSLLREPSQKEAPPNNPPRNTSASEPPLRAREPRAQATAPAPRSAMLAADERQLHVSPAMLAALVSALGTTGAAGTAAMAIAAPNLNTPPVDQSDERSQFELDVELDIAHERLLLYRVVVVLLLIGALIITRQAVLLWLTV